MCWGQIRFWPSIWRMCATHQQFHDLELVCIWFVLENNCKGFMLIQKFLISQYICASHLKGLYKGGIILRNLHIDTEVNETMEGCTVQELLYTLYNFPSKYSGYCS